MGGLRFPSYTENKDEGKWGGTMKQINKIMFVYMTILIAIMMTFSYMYISR